MSVATQEAFKPIDFDAIFTIRKAESPEPGDFILEALAVTSDLDLQGDIITAEAIKGAEKDLEKNSTVLFNHDQNQAVGKVLFSEARPEGLFVKIRISATAQKIRTLIREGVINKLSIQGKILDKVSEFDPKVGQVVTKILKMVLTEAGLVAIPANSEAQTLSWFIAKAIKGREEMEKGTTTPAGGTETAVKPAETPPASTATTETTPAKPAETPPATTETPPPAATPPVTETVAKTDATTETAPDGTIDALTKQIAAFLGKAEHDDESKAALVTVLELLDKIKADPTGEKVPALIQEAMAMLRSVQARGSDNGESTSSSAKAEPAPGTTPAPAATTTPAPAPAAATTTAPAPAPAAPVAKTEESVELVKTVQELTGLVTLMARGRDLGLVGDSGGAMRKGLIGDVNAKPTTDRAREDRYGDSTDPLGTTGTKMRKGNPIDWMADALQKDGSPLGPSPDGSC